MQLKIETKDLTTIKTDLLVVNIHDGKLDSSSLAAKVDKKLGGLIKQIISNENFTGATLSTKLIHTQGKIPASKVLVVGLGEEKKFESLITRRIGGLIIRMAKELKATHITTAIHGGLFKNVSKADCAQALAEGLYLGDYQFTRYKKGTPNPVKEIVLLCPDKKQVAAVTKAANRGKDLAKAVSFSRDLVNTPGHDMTPLNLAKAAQGLPGVKTKIYHLAEIKKMKMGSYLGVAMGSTANPPAFIEMHYKPATKAKKTVVLIGKGVTFDSGGLSLKPPKFMETMKDDMAGAAAVIGLMSVISKLKPKVEVWGLVAATENMPDGHAIRPGDVITAMNGKTIEVLNTDAEGRLTLADALCHAQKKKPDIVIDMATLTGACLVALGNDIAAIMGNDDGLVEDLRSCAKKTAEPLWPLPLVEDYRKELDSPIADLKNIGGAYAGTITAGLFLQEFVGDFKWAHIDIAGPSWTDKPREFESRGGTGCMVRLLADFLDQ